MHSEAEKNMAYIQSLFLKVPELMQGKPAPDELVAILDAEPLLFRSIAYESASLEIAWHDLLQGSGLQEWRTFYALSHKAHSFHLEIGLGWAFAKSDHSPEHYAALLNPGMRRMVYDGIGYYKALFHGRRTVGNQEVPEGVSGQDLPGFDQGLGRRLWYRAKGGVPELKQLVRPFPSYRCADIWRGVGIACGYVGGCDTPALEALLAASGAYKSHLSLGTALAAVSRHASASLTNDIETACKVICNLDAGDIIQLVGRKWMDNPGDSIRQLETALTGPVNSIPSK